MPSTVRASLCRASNSGHHVAIHFFAFQRGNAPYWAKEVLILWLCSLPIASPV